MRGVRDCQDPSLCDLCGWLKLETHHQCWRVPVLSHEPHGSGRSITDAIGLTMNVRDMHIHEEGHLIKRCHTLLRHTAVRGLTPLDASRLRGKGDLGYEHLETFLRHVFIIDCLTVCHIREEQHCYIPFHDHNCIEITIQNVRHQSRTFH